MSIKQRASSQDFEIVKCVNPKGVMIVDKRQHANNKGYETIMMSLLEPNGKDVLYMDEVKSPYVDIRIHTWFSDTKRFVNAMIDDNVYSYEGNIEDITVNLSRDYHFHIATKRIMFKMICRDIYKAWEAGKDVNYLIKSGMKIKNFAKTINEMLLFIDTMQTHQPNLIDENFFVHYATYAMEEDLNHDWLIYKFEQEYVI